MIKKFYISPEIAKAAIKVLREDSRVKRYEKIDGVRTESILCVATVFEDFVSLVEGKGCLCVTCETWGDGGQDG